MQGFSSALRVPCCGYESRVVERDFPTYRLAIADDLALTGSQGGACSSADAMTFFKVPSPVMDTSITSPGFK